MATDGMADRIAIGPRSAGTAYGEFGARVRRAAAFLVGLPGDKIGLIDVNSDAVPLALFSSVAVGKPYVPVNYRLTDAQLVQIVRRMAPATVVVGDGIADRIGDIEGIALVERKKLLDIAADNSAPQIGAMTCEPDDIAVLLFTSGTTGEPKAAILRHRHLAGYILSSVEFAGADETDAALVSVPPYHIAGVSAVLSNTYNGRRVIYLEVFDPAEWVRLIEQERITHAMVVPTMLGRILDVVEATGADLSTLRALSYGGGPMPLPVIERAIRVLPGVGFVNAYGLTETSSTIAVLGPEDHREAFASDDPAVRARLASVGRPLPALEVSIRDEIGDPLPAGERGEIWVRGEQVSGEYLTHRVVNDEGWLPTRDAGTLDEGGYLFVHGRLDDVIVRGGENLSPGEIEAVLLEHPGVAEAAVLGLPDQEWGEKVVAVVVPETGATLQETALQDHVRARLRSTRTPEAIQFRTALPYSETGKLLRRVLRKELGEFLS
ncbi:class I adenylate-forming enzyme family protein [Nocardia fusca]|uniref:class I adenylate-forming enzyme family protein n=1 Tax=Nocardia fusca TaxID=941183 RepID=UPI0037956AAF